MTWGDDSRDWPESDPMPADLAERVSLSRKLSDLAELFRIEANAWKRLEGVAAIRLNVQHQADCRDTCNRTLYAARLLAEHSRHILAMTGDLETATAYVEAGQIQLKLLENARRLEWNVLRDPS